MKTKNSMTQKNSERKKPEPIYLEWYWHIHHFNHSAINRAEQNIQELDILIVVYTHDSDHNPSFTWHKCYNVTISSTLF